MDTERKPIPGFDGKYEIDLAGNVYAMTAYQRYAAGRTLRVTHSKDGYAYVGLYWKGKVVSGYIHRLLMLTFNPIENAQDFEVNHIDLNKSNNDLTNLEWLTHQANIQHAHKMNAWDANGPKGETTITAKLTDENIRQIRILRQAGVTFKAIGAQFGVSNTAIRDVIIGRSWGHVK
jgi:hypothetical protein